MKIEDIFSSSETGTLTLEQFQQIVSEGNAKFVDLSEGNYVSAHKYTSEVESLERQIETLTETVNQREADIQNFQEQLTAAGNDAEMLAEVSNELKALQARYDEDAEAYEQQLSDQAREFAVKEYAATKEFTSPAAKKYYIEQMIASEDVDFNKKGELQGMADFDEMFAKDNEGAFKVVEQLPEVGQESTSDMKKPTFAAPTPGAQKPETSKMSLTDMMKAKNDNPEATINF